MVPGLMTTPNQRQAETADNKQINVSGGEFVFDADAVRFYGLEKIQAMQQKAQEAMNRVKQGLSAKPPAQPGSKPPGAGKGPPGMPSIGMPNQGQPISATPGMGPQPQRPTMGATMPRGIPQTPPAPNPSAPPTPVPQQQPRLNFATGGYVAPMVPQSPDFKEIQAYYANMNKNSGIPKTIPKINPQTGGLQYNYVDPVTGKPVETTPVKGPSSGYYARPATTPLKISDRAGGNDLASTVATSAALGLGLPIVGGLVKDWFKESTGKTPLNAAKDYVKGTVQDLLGSGGNMYGSNAVTPIAGTPSGFFDGMTAPDLAGGFEVPSASNPITGGVDWAAELAGAAPNPLAATPSLGSSAALAPAEFTFGPAGVDAAASSVGADLLSSTGVDALAGSAGADILGGAGAAEALAGSEGIAALGGADGLFGSLGMGATSGGIGGALGGALTAGAYAAPALIAAMALSSIAPPDETYKSYGGGFSEGLGDLTGEAMDPRINDFYSKIKGDGKWYEGGDLSKTGRMDVDMGYYTKGNVPYWSVYGTPFDSEDKAITAAQKKARKRMGLDTTEEQFGSDAASIASMYSNKAVPLFTAPDDINSVDWGRLVDERNAQGTGEGANMATDINSDPRYSHLSPEAKRYLGIGWSPYHSMPYS